MVRIEVTLCVHCETLLGNLWVEPEIVGNDLIIYHARGTALLVIRRNNNRRCKKSKETRFHTMQSVFGKIYAGLKLDSCNYTRINTGDIDTYIPERRPH